jgi:hypothetical protein
VGLTGCAWSSSRSTFGLVGFGPNRSNEVEGRNGPPVAVVVTANEFDEEAASDDMTAEWQQQAGL